MEKVTGPARGAVDVIVPFGGDADQAEELAAALGGLKLGATDTLTVADNTPAGVLRPDATGAGPLVGLPHARVVEAVNERSSYHARNVAAAGGRGEWLLFTDADCVPSTALIDEYISAIEADETGSSEPTRRALGIVAGSVASLPGQAALAARYAASRGHIGERGHLEAETPAGVTANLLVRRAAFEQLGGFREGVRSGADVEFCLRAQAAGWRLIHAPEARVEHRHPETVGAMLAKARRHGAGRRWVNGQVPGALARPAFLRAYLRGPLAAAALVLTGRRERARFKLLDIRHSTALLHGYWLGDNVASPWPETPPSRR